VVRHRGRIDRTRRDRPDFAHDPRAAEQPMTAMSHARRYAEIVAVLVKYGFVDVVRALHLTPYLNVGRRILTATGKQTSLDADKAQRVRMALEALGPTFVKFGQALSTRVDLLPSDVVAELTKLQDDVAPLPSGACERIIEEVFGQPISTLFESFDPMPLAAASIAQVHRATLPNGEAVAIKVRRPGIDRTIEADLMVLSDLARLAERYIPDATLYSLSGLVEEFARTIRRELDLAREGRIVERVAAQFSDDPRLRFPRIHWPLTRRDVLTMEYLDGVKVSAISTQTTPELDAAAVAKTGADFVFRQILVHGLFHADPHPGNILVLPGNVVAFIDFGSSAGSTRRCAIAWRKSSLRSAARTPSALRRS
jgi:ubiquinone biosynthesis protein